jgi:hypothetical protein
VNPTLPQSRWSKRLRNLWLAALLAGVSLVQARADDLFQISANAFGPGGVAIQPTAGGSDLSELVRNLISASGGFSGIDQSYSYSARLRYADVQNAIQFQEIAPTGTIGHTARLIIPSTGLNVNFNNGGNGYANTDQLEDAIDDYIKKEGSAEWAKFLKSMAKQSSVALTDGNPESRTAQEASQAYMNFGQEPGLTSEERQDPSRRSENFGMGFTADVGRFDANGFKGTTYSLPLYANFKLTERIGLRFNIPLYWTRLEGANIFSAGLMMGVPIKIIPHTKDSPWYWQLTPSGGANASGSKEFVAGGLLVNGGLTSLLSYDVNPHLSVSMGNHFSYHEGLEYTIDDYTFDPGVSQEIVKNGLKVSVPFGRRWIVEVYGIHSAFLESAAVDHYFTVGGELGYRFLGKGSKKRSGYVKIGAYSDMGDNFSSAHAQFGTGWKF